MLLANLGTLEADILQKRLQKQAREMKPKNQTPCMHYARHGRCRLAEHKHDDTGSASRVE